MELELTYTIMSDSMMFLVKLGFIIINDLFKLHRHQKIKKLPYFFCKQSHITLYVIE